MNSHGYGRNNLRIPPITGLMAFESVARNGSFSKAADELSITQSAVSHRISQLESLLSTSLLIRIGHSVSLAPAGKELLPYVREGLGCLRDGLAKISTEGKPSLWPDWPGILAIATDGATPEPATPTSTPPERLDLQDTRAIADFVLEHARPRHTPSRGA